MYGTKAVRRSEIFADTYIIAVCFLLGTSPSVWILYACTVYTTHEWSCLQAGPLRTLHEISRCTVTTDTRVIFQHKTSPERPFSHYIHSHRLAAEIWATVKNNLLGNNFLSCFFHLYGFRKYMSYGFPIIKFCNPGVHYETPRIIRHVLLPYETPCIIRHLPLPLT